jgi:hypothetical protein
MTGYFVSFFITHLINFLLSLHRLLKISRITIPFYVPAFSSAAAAAAVLGSAGIHGSIGLSIAYIALFDLLRSCEPQKAMVYLLLCIVVGAAQPFVVLSLRNKDNGIPLRRDPRTYERENPCEF